MAAGEVQDQVAVERFGEAGVGDGGGEAAGGEGFGGFLEDRKSVV